MPIVAVHHVGLPPVHLTQVLHGGQDRAREQDEPSMVIGFTVDHATFESRRDVEQISGHVIIPRPPHPQFFGALTQRQEGGRDGPLHGHTVLPDLTVAR